MARILLLTVDLDLPDAPVNGGVLRVRQLKRHLGALGHEVLVSMPFDRLADLEASSHDLEIAYPEARPQVAVEHVDPDVILCEQWHLASVLGAHSAPLWLDLHGSLLGENAFRQKGGGEAHARYDQETRAKLRAFADADIITCAGHRQRLYFRGWRAIAGRSFADWEVWHLPLAIEPNFPDTPTEKPTTEGLRLVYAGNLWPWIDLHSWLPAFFDVVAGRPGATVDFFVDDPLQHRDCLSLLGEAGAGAGWQQLVAEHRVSVGGRIPHQEFVDRISRYDAAVDLFSWNSERELALTTRTLEYLSFGLPVLYPGHAELAESISEINPRWLVHELSHQALEHAVESLVDERDNPQVLRDTMRKMLERRDREAANRCEHVMHHLESGTRPRHEQDPGDRRLVSLSNDVVRASLAESKKRFTQEQERAERAESREHELINEQQTWQRHRRELETSLQDEAQQVEDLKASILKLEHELIAAQGEIGRLREAESQLVERHTREISRLRKAESKLIERHTREIGAIQQQLKALSTENERSAAALVAAHTTSERRLTAEIDQLKRLQVARQAGSLVAAARPDLRTRGLARRVRLWWLYVDHVAVRLYLSIWQRLRGRRIFPGM